MKYHEMTKNYIFREFTCQLSVEETAELCFKSVRTVTEWDRGKTIPRECRRLMKMAKGRALGTSSDWKQFKMNGNKMELPTGRLVSCQEILTGIALLEIQSELELATSTKLLRYARAIASILSKS
ncbi:regulator [Vibrio sp. LaRot3]|uniref:regulator n=1 Tax=Vibrio sp. LaRot3 TaxID=2998829 RepID=UPI0022CDE13B|nr:regulator [Vibrio sp. LaRot3]MDA0148346.1 regulator [Vibrio sp. LaRot3]